MTLLPKNIFITGIDTNIGKTISSAVITEALQADYWKPIQTGDLDESDSARVRHLVSNTKSHIHPDRYQFRVPTNPYTSGLIENKTIDFNEIQLPDTANRLIIEGAGGAMVPLTREKLIVDLIAHLGVPVIVIAKNYLGAINHTLLTLELLKSRHIPILGVVYNDTQIDYMREIIQYHSGIPTLGSISSANEINPNFIAVQAAAMRLSLAEHFSF